MKILIDITLALIGFILLSPVLLLVSILILLIEWNSPFFLQKRVGYKMREFTILKFRTMLKGEITPLGKVLRATGIDELPQIINVLLLDMSIVGPRPLTQHDIDRLGWDKEEFKMRWNVRPGIIGLAQLSNICDARVSWTYDRSYVKTHNIWMDAKIFVASMAVPFVGKKKLRNWVHAK